MRRLPRWMSLSDELPTASSLCWPVSWVQAESRGQHSTLSPRLQSSVRRPRIISLARNWSTRNANSPSFDRRYAAWRQRLSNYCTRVYSRYLIRCICKPRYYYYCRHYERRWRQTSRNRCSNWVPLEAPGAHGTRDSSRGLRTSSTCSEMFSVLLHG